MDYHLIQYGCDNCGELTEVMDCDQPLPEGWTTGEGRHTHYCPQCSKRRQEMLHYAQTGGCHLDEV